MHLGMVRRISSSSMVRRSCRGFVSNGHEDVGGRPDQGLRHREAAAPTGDGGQISACARAAQRTASGRGGPGWGPRAGRRRGGGRGGGGGGPRGRGSGRDARGGGESGR